METAFIRLTRTFALLFCLCTALIPADRNPARLRVLVLTGMSDRPYHDWRETAPFLRKALEQTGRFSVHLLEEPAGLTGRTLESYDVLLLNYNGPRWDSGAERAIEEFVRSGKGLVAVHGVTYGTFMGMEMGPERRWVRSTKKDAEWTTYSDMLGVTWAPENIGHAVRHAFPVKLIDREHPVTRGVDPEFIVNDELYHKMSFKPGTHILATAFSDTAKGGTGKDEPMAWTVSFGKGRVFYTPLGHDISAMYNAGFVTLLARGAEWAATGDVTLPPKLPLDPEPKDPVKVLVATGGHGYETSFYGIFQNWPDIVWSHATSQAEAFRPDMENRWDVLVLYDMHNEIGELEKNSLRAFVEAGKGIVALHHSIVDYTSWPWWYEEVIGGKYFEKPEGGHPASSFKEGLPLIARPVRGMAGHPVIREIGDLETWDEAYKGMWHSPRIKVLMETDNPLNDRPLVYLGPHPAAKVVYIQLGHSAYTHKHPSYRKLVHNAILWSSGRLQ